MGVILGCFCPKKGGALYSVHTMRLSREMIFRCHASGERQFEGVFGMFLVQRFLHFEGWPGYNSSAKLSLQPDPVFIAFLEALKRETFKGIGMSLKTNITTKNKSASTEKQSALEKATSKKLKIKLLEQAFLDLGMGDKALRVHNCGSYLEIKTYIEEGSSKLHSGKFCSVRLCPMCSWRLSQKRFSNLSKVIETLHANGKYHLLFLTLTVKNPEGADLKQTIKQMLKAWAYMSHDMPEFSRSVSGWFRAIEITYNQESDTYHPHIHIVLAVKPGYFCGKYYITQKEWVAMWRSALKVDYDPIVDICKEYKKDKSLNLISEASKYATKDSEYLISDNQDLTNKIVDILDKSLHRVRLIAYGGILKEIYEKLNLDDSFKDKEKQVVDGVVLYIIHAYRWMIGFQKYKKIDTELPILKT